MLLLDNIYKRYWKRSNVLKFQFKQKGLKTPEAVPKDITNFFAMLELAIASSGINHDVAGDLYTELCSHISMIFEKEDLLDNNIKTYKP